MAKVSGKVGLIKIRKRTTRFNGKAHSSPYYMMKHTEENQMRKKLKLFMWRLEILRVRMERV